MDDRPISVAQALAEALDPTLFFDRRGFDVPDDDRERIKRGEMPESPAGVMALIAWKLNYGPHERQMQRLTAAKPHVRFSQGRTTGLWKRDVVTEGEMSDAEVMKALTQKHDELASRVLAKGEDEPDAIFEGSPGTWKVPHPEHDLCHQQTVALERLERAEGLNDEQAALLEACRAQLRTERAKLLHGVKEKKGLAKEIADQKRAKHLGIQPFQRVDHEDASGVVIEGGGISDEGY